MGYNLTVARNPMAMFVWRDIGQRILPCEACNPQHQGEKNGRKIDGVGHNPAHPGGSIVNANPG